MNRVWGQCLAAVVVGTVLFLVSGFFPPFEGALSALSVILIIAGIIGMVLVLITGYIGSGGNAP
jgi:hypothetical protein